MKRKKIIRDPETHEIVETIEYGDTFLPVPTGDRRHMYHIQTGDVLSFEIFSAEEKERAKLLADGNY